MMQAEAPPVPKRRTSLRAMAESGIYAGSQLFITGIGLVASLIVRLVVPVATFGAYALTQGSYSVANGYNGSLRTVLERKLAEHHAKKDAASAERFLSNLYTFMTLGLVVESIGFAIAGLLAHDRLIALAFYTIAAFNLFDSLAVADTLAIRAQRRLSALAIGSFASGFARAAILVAFSYAWGGPGYLVGLFVGAAFSFATFRAILRRTYRWRARIDITGLREVFAIGWPITLFRIANAAFLVTDRFAIAAVLGITALGQYSLAASITGALAIVPMALGGATFSRIIAHVTRGDPAETAATAHRLHVTLLTLTSISFAAVSALLPLLLARFLPKYVDATVPLQIMLFSGYFATTFTVAQQISVASDRMMFPTIASVVGIAALGGSGLLLAKLAGLVGVAIASTACVAAYSLAYNAWVQRGIPGLQLLPPVLYGLAPIAAVAALSLVSVPLAILLWAILAWAALILLSRLHGHSVRGIMRMASEKLPWRERGNDR